MDTSWVALGVGVAGVLTAAHLWVGRRRAERDFRQATHRLEAHLAVAEAARRTLALEACRLEAAQTEASNRAARLTGDAARALAEPVAALTILADSLSGATEAPISRRTRDPIQASVRRVRALVEDLAALSEAELPPPLIGRVDPLLIVGQAAAAAAEFARDQGVDLSAPRPAPGLVVAADAERMRRILDRLIDNAIRYNRPGGVVMIEVRRAAAGVTVRVHDSGQGVSAHRLTTLFEAFPPSSEGSRRGAGLAIARRLAASMGARLDLDSAEAEGSTASLTLAVAPALADPVSQEPLRLTLLHIDDDPVARGVMRHAAAAMPDVRVHGADTVHAGLALARDLRPDAVLIDARMVRGDATAVRRLLDGDALTLGLPLVVIGPRDAAAREVENGSWLETPLDGRALALLFARLVARGRGGDTSLAA